MATVIEAIALAQCRLGAKCGRSGKTTE